MTWCEHDSDPAVCPVCRQDPPAPPEPKTAECLSCRAEIIWTITAKGNLMPVDADPSDDGNVLLEVEADGTVRALMIHAGVLPGGERHTSHFATCPQAEAWRRR